MKNLVLFIIILAFTTSSIVVKAIPDVYIHSYVKEDEAREAVLKTRRQQETDAANAKEFGKNALIVIAVLGAIFLVYRLHKQNKYRENLDIGIKLIKEGASDDYVEKISKLSIAEIAELRMQIK